MPDLVLRIVRPSSGDGTSPFPPRSVEDGLSYDRDLVAEGYLSCVLDRTAPVPGPNHSPAFRWGWTNALRDMAPSADDGYDRIRSDTIEALRRAA